MIIASHKLKYIINKIICISINLNIITLLVLISINISAQNESPKFSFNGYLSDNQSASFDSIQEQWISENLFHNRLNFKFFSTENLSAALEIRNRFVYGNRISFDPTAAPGYEQKTGIIDINKNIVKGKSYVLNSTVERMWFAYEKGKIKATIGRQRINWGMSLAWNPNDIFNSYSFFDIDYIERPGSDAIRLQYYNSEVSSSELAVKMNHEKKITAAALYKFNAFEYDFQLLSGIVNSNNYVFGGGWSGAIKHLAFRGEVSYFQPYKSNDSLKTILSTISFDYLFANSFSLLVEYLYSNHSVLKELSFSSLYNAPMSAKNIALANHNIVVQASYPITPLLSSSMAVMLLPGINGYYLAPSLSYSLSQNIDASVYCQRFSGSFNNEKIRYQLLFFKMKLSF